MPKPIWRDRQDWDEINGNCCWPGCTDASDDQVPLCWPHMIKAYTRVQGRLNLQTLASTTQRDMAQARVDKADTPFAQAAAAQSLVYYVRVAPDTIKIGHTVNIKQRMSALRVPLASLLATEPGGEPLERMRHKQFAHLRHGRLENFTDAPDLASHIAMLIEHYGPPTITTWVKVA